MTLRSLPSRTSAVRCTLPVRRPGSDMDSDDMPYNGAVAAARLRIRRGVERRAHGRVHRWRILGEVAASLSRRLAAQAAGAPTSHLRPSAPTATGSRSPRLRAPRTSSHTVHLRRTQAELLQFKAKCKDSTGNARVYRSSALTSKPFTFTYGVAAARIRFDQKQGQNGAFWLQYFGSSSGGGTEIDVIESGGRGRI